MSRHFVLRATRPSGPSSSQVDRGADLADRRWLSFWCASNHETILTLAADAEPPVLWVCRRCGAPASSNATAAPSASSAQVFRTPYEFLMMRRTVEDGEKLLAEALAALRARVRR